MTSPDPQATMVRDFEAVGVTEAEERLYRELLLQPASTLGQLTDLLQLPANGLRKLLAALEGKGLVTSSTTKPRIYVPVAPDIALDALIEKQSQALAHARAAATALRERTRPIVNRSTTEGQLLEVFDNREDMLRAIAQVQRSAKSECLCLDKPPYVSGPPDTVDRMEIDALSRNVSYRTLIDDEAFKLPGVLDRIRTSIDAGASVRVASKLPLKMLIVDGAIGLIPVNLHELTGPVVLVRSSSLLDALREFFELLWQQASPVAFTRSGEFKTADDTVKLPINIDQLIPRLAAGANDKTIAADLGLSPRTFDRRIYEFMKNLNARTRFQAGWLAAHKLVSRVEH